VKLNPALVAMLLAFPLLSGCGSSPKSTFYTLSSGAAPERAPATAPLSVAIDAVTVPDIVDRPQFVVRVAANQVTLYEFHRWASPLKSEIARVIAANLARELGTTRVWSYAQTTLPSPDYQVLVDVQRFDSALGDAATIDVLAEAGADAELVDMLRRAVGSSDGVEIAWTKL